MATPKTLRELSLLAQQASWHLPKRPARYLSGSNKASTGAASPPEGFTTWDEFAQHLDDAIQGGRDGG